MSWEQRYSPPNIAEWQGRKDLPPHAYFFQHMHLLNLLTDKPKKTASRTFALLGFGGAAFDGPQAIRHALAKLPLQKTSIHCYDAGNIIYTDHDIENTQAALSEVVAQLLAAHLTPIVIGGGHELAFGHYEGIKKIYPAQKRLGIINFDAHLDLYKPANGSSSANTAFYQIADSHRQEGRHFDYNCIGIQHTGNIRQLFDTANKFNTKLIFADELHQGLHEKCVDFIDRIIDENDLIYMSLSLDVFAPAFAPGVKAIQPLGLTPWQVISLIRQLAASAKAISYDIAEYLPNNDIDHRTATLAAMLIDEIIHHHKAPPYLR
jgi:formiminoglutamase